MEAILRSVLLRQEQMEMQWDAEFEQQKQLFHINTSTLIDLLPIQPRKKRLKIEGRVPIPSHDKENLVGFLGFVPNGASLKSPKTKAPHSRGLAKRDLNTRFCDNDVKDMGRVVATKPAESQPSLRNCLDVERIPLNASILHAVKSTNQGSVRVSVKVEADEGDVHVSPPIDDSPSGENRKRLRGEQVEDIELQNDYVQNVVPSNDGEEIREKTNQTALVDLAEKKSKPKRARKVGKAKECAVEVEAQELSCRDTHVARGNEPEMVCKVEVGTEVETGRDAQEMKSEIVSKVIEPEIVSKGTSRRGRVKGLATKQTAEPQVSQRVTRSRARMVDRAVESKAERVTRSRVAVSVVESEPEICEKMPSTQVICNESALQDVKLEPLCEAEVQDRSPNQIVEGQVDEYSNPDVCALPKEILRDELRSKQSSHFKGQKSVTCFAGKDSTNVSAANDLARLGSSHVGSQDNVVSSRVRSGEEKERVNSRIAEILANVKATSVDQLKDGQHESQAQPRLDRIEKGLGYREVAVAPVEHPVPSMCKETELQGGNTPWAVFDATTDEEEVAKVARFLVASEGDALIEKVIEDTTKERAPIQLEVIGGEMQANISEAPLPSAAGLSPCEAASQCLGKEPTLISNVTSISEISGTAPLNIKETYATLLSEVIEGTILPLKKSGDLESLTVSGSLKSSLRSGRISPVAIPLELSEAGNDASASVVHVQPTAGATRKSTVAEFSVAGRDGSGEHPVEVLNISASERLGSEIDNVIDKDSIKANDGRTQQTTRECTQDVVMSTTSEVSLAKEPNNSGNSKDEACRMDLAREQVKSDAVSPVRYSEARAVEEAMRCSLEQEFHPDVTLTLNRWQFRKRLSPRSKARARRWRSDVATNGVDYGRGHSSDAPAASPSRVVSSTERSLEGAAYETFLETQSPEFPVQGIESSFSLGAGMAVDQAIFITQQEHASESERSARRSISSLCNEILGQDLRDGEIGDNSVEYEIMKTADENGNPSPLPLLQSIYTLSKACQNDMMDARGFLGEGEQQQVQTLIESAKKIMEHLSSKAVLPQPKTPASNYSAPNNSRFHGHTNLYPDRFRLFITPRSSPAAPPTFPSSSSTYLSSAAPEIAGDTESISPQMKDIIRETIEQAVSRSPHLDSILSEPAVEVDKIASPAPSRPPSSGNLMTISDTSNIYLLGESKNALKDSSAVGFGCKSFTAVDPIQSILASDGLPNGNVRDTSTVGPAIPLLALQNASALQSRDGSTQLIVELVTHQSEGPLDLETVVETEKLSELRSRFYALSKDYVGTSSAVKDVPNLLGDGPECLISHSTNPPSPIPNLRFSPVYASKLHKGIRQSFENNPLSPRDSHFDAGENERPAVVVEENSRIPCSPIFIGNQCERVDPQQDDNPEPVEVPVERSHSIGNVVPASMLRVEPLSSSNLLSDVPSVPPSNSNLPRSNLVTSLRSFIPLVHQQQPPAHYPNGKRDVKVKALEAAEAAKRLAEQKEFEKQERKKAAELAKREKQERAAQEKLAKREKAAQEKLKQQEARAEREHEEASKRKAVAAGPTKSVMADSTNCQGANSQNVLLKVKKTHDLKLKMDLEKQERLLEEQRRKEEEWKKKEADNAARKRKHEAAEKKEKEEKRRRQEETMKAHRELEERQRLELEKKTQKQRAMEELEKERKAIEEEIKRQKRLDKEREVEQRRRKEEERELAWLEEKEATRKRKEEAAKQMKLLETEGRQQAVKMRRPSEDPAMPSAGPYHSFMASLHIAMGIGEGIGAHLSGVNNVVDPQRVSSQSLVGHPLRVLQHSSEGAGTIRNSQAALRLPRTTPESVPGVSNTILGSGKPLFRTPPEALCNAVSASTAVSGGGGSTAKVLRDRINILQVQSGSKTGAAAVVGNSKPCQPGQVGFAGPPGGVIGIGDKGLQSYEISPFRDSEDEDSEEEEKRSQKPIPQWARKENMLPQLVRQLEQDPDDIFAGASSCSLDEVFEVKGSKKRPDFKRRGSSGDWAKDCLTWQEQIQYKVTMGYLH